MRWIAHAPLADAPDLTLNVKTIDRAHGATGAMITSGIAFVSLAMSNLPSTSNSSEEILSVPMEARMSSPKATALALLLSFALATSASARVVRFVASPGVARHGPGRAMDDLAEHGNG